MRLLCHLKFPMQKFVPRSVFEKHHYEAKQNEIMLFAYSDSTCISLPYFPSESSYHPSVLVLDK